MFTYLGVPRIGWRIRGRFRASFLNPALSQDICCTMRIYVPFSRLLASPLSLDRSGGTFSEPSHANIVRFVTLDSPYPSATRVLIARLTSSTSSMADQTSTAWSTLS